MQLQQLQHRSKQSIKAVTKAVKPYQLFVALLCTVLCGVFMYVWYTAVSATATLAPAAVLDTDVNSEADTAAPTAVNNDDTVQHQYDDAAMDDGAVFDMIDGMMNETNQVLGGGYAQWLAEHPEEDNDAEHTDG